MQRSMVAKGLGRCARGVLLALLGVSSAYAEVAGQICGREGSPLAGIKVMAYGVPGATGGERPLLAQALTTGNGMFRLPLTAAQASLLTLTGKEGVGRLKVSAAQWPLKAVYPVKTVVALVHDNDIHFNYNYQELVAENLAAARKRYEHLLLLHLGDVFNRHKGSWGGKDGTDLNDYAQRSKYMIETLNKLGYQLMTPGNHELDYLDGHTLAALAQARFPIIAANIKIETDLLPPLKPCHIFRLDNDMTVACLGLSTVNFKKVGVSKQSPDQVASAYAHLADTNTIYVGMTHIGYKADVALVKNHPEFDVILGGHSHTYLPKSQLINGVLVAQTGGAGPVRTRPYFGVDPLKSKHLGVVEIELENERIVRKQGRVMVLSDEFPLQAFWDVEQSEKAPPKIVLRLGNPTFLPFRAEVRLGEKTVAPSAWRSHRVELEGGMEQALVYDYKPAGRFTAAEFIAEISCTVKGVETKHKATMELNALPRVGALKIDGDLKDWSTTGRRKKFTVADVGPMPKVKGQSAPSDEPALSGEIICGWNEQGVAWGVTVSDDEHHNSAKDIMRGDALQFALLDSDKRLQRMIGGADFMGGLALVKQGAKFANLSGETPEGFKYAVQRDETRRETTYEWQIPLNALALPARSGSSFAFSLAVLDDNSGTGPTTCYELSKGFMPRQNITQFPVFMLTD